MESFPDADMKQFHAFPGGVSFNYQGMSYDVFMTEIGGLIHHYSGGVGVAMERALGIRKLTPITLPPSNFPMNLSPTKIAYPFQYGPQPIDLINLDFKIFETKVRDIFQVSYKHTNKKESYSWLSAPSLNYYPQRLNFALWCATGGCGIAQDMQDPIFRFHVIFTTRRILYELGGQLPGDSGFTMVGTYNKAAHERLCNEFGISTKDSFRFEKGPNKGIGFVYATDGKKVHIAWGSQRPIPKEDEYNSKWPNGQYKFGDPYTPVGFLYNPLAGKQYEYFIPPKGHGLRNLGRLNRSIEAFVYCVLGAQVNTRSSIVGGSGGAMEAQQEFLTLFESAIIENNIAKSIQRYQFAVQQARAKLDFAIAPGCWLLPSYLVINTKSVAGYNNKLQKATSDMKYGVNDVNAVAHFIPKKIITPPKKRVPTIKEESHNYLKVGVSAAAMGVGYYLFR